MPAAKRKRKPAQLSLVPSGPLSKEYSDVLDRVLAERNLESDILDVVYDYTPGTSERWTNEMQEYLHEQIMQVVNAYLETRR